MGIAYGGPEECLLVCKTAGGWIDSQTAVFWHTTDSKIVIAKFGIYFCFTAFYLRLLCCKMVTMANRSYMHIRTNAALTGGSLELSLQTLIRLFTEFQHQTEHRSDGYLPRSDYAHNLYGNAISDHINSQLLRQRLITINR